VKKSRFAEQNRLITRFFSFEAAATLRGFPDAIQVLLQIHFVTILQHAPEKAATPPCLNIGQVPYILTWRNINSKSMDFGNFLLLSSSFFSSNLILPSILYMLMEASGADQV
jgi:hypothetical protein